ncbi:MAG TPA: tyrosine-type recombinase/integrase, partial [Candidatus Paceibacterota bacterium]|nr:tyrosine-type recombinase/integrase [Candidatus Paceibacterota bacterium]
HIGRCPRFADYVNQTYAPWLATSDKSPATKASEMVHLRRWSASIVGSLHLDKIRAYHINGQLQKLNEQGKAIRTCKIAVIVLRNVLNKAIDDDYIKTLPIGRLKWQKGKTKARTLYTHQDIDLFCRGALVASKNGVEFTDYLRLLALCGAREKEMLRVRWADVDFKRRLLTIGADANTKNREPRCVDMSPALEAHLRDMASRRAPDSQWLFPSPQRGERDERSKTFRESLLLTRAVSGHVCRGCQHIIPGKEPFTACTSCGSANLEAKEHVLPDNLQRIGFHDLRHHFISYAVMSGIDFMTIARWVGHKDGGILIGKVYGHLSNEHAQAQAARLRFGPTILPFAQEGTV